MKVLQMGLGPLGIQVAKYINDKTEVKTVAAVDINEALIGKSLSNISDELPDNVNVFKSVEEAINSLPKKPDAAIITTVSNLERLISSD